MEIKIKQNKNTSVVLRVSSFCIALVVLFCSIAIPTFADDSVNWNSYISPVFLGTDSNATRYNGGLPFLTTSSSYRGSTSTTNLTVYQCLVYNSSSSSIYYTFLSETEGTPGNGKIIRPSGNSYESYNASLTGHEGNIGYSAVYIGGTLNTANAAVPVFSSFEEAATSLNSFLNGGGGSSEPYPVEFALNPGYCAFLDISDITGVEVDLYTTLFGGADWNNHRTDQAIGSVASLPSSFSLPISGTSAISWSGTGSKNILGQYKSFSASYTYTSSGTRYLVIVNPLQASLGAQLTAMASMPSERNNPISVSVTLARSCKIYSMTSSLDVGSGNLDIESNGDTNSGTPDENGNWSWVNDQTGTPIEPGNLPIGGGNDPIIGQETSINDWLQDIANQIKGFFSGAIGAVTTLVGAGSSFIHTLISLYSWLPAPVYAVLSSALILVITIGVIKVFI